MPEATSTQPAPIKIENPNLSLENSGVKYLDQEAINLHKNLQSNLNKGGIQQDTRPAKEQPVGLPEYFRDPSTHVTNSGVSKKVPGSFESGNWIDQMRHKIPEELDQLTNPDDPQSPPPIVGSASAYSEIARQKEEDKLKRDTSPESAKKGPVAGFFDWLHR